jgi:transposase-like protein
MPSPTVAVRPNRDHGHRFAREVIAHAVRLSLRFTRSVRDVEELLAERGTEVSYETVRRRVAKFRAYHADELRRREVRPCGAYRSRIPVSASASHRRPSSRF